MDKILLVDRCSYSLQGIKELLSANKNRHISEADNLLVARERIIQWRPTLVIADFSSFSDQLHNIQQISAIYSACGKTTQLMVLLGDNTPEIAVYCSGLGTREIYSKSLPLPELNEQIEKTLNTNPTTYYKHRRRNITSLLSLREEKVLNLWTEAASNETIAKELGISSKTVYTYKRNIRLKLGVDNRFSLFLAMPY